MAQGTELAGHVLGGKYRLVRSVSDGPRKVYEARHERLAGRFAVKQWPATTPWDAFRRGAELAMTLRHPGVLQVLDFNCEPGSSPFLVLEWVDGARLSDVIAESGILPVERVAPLIESAAWALASAHQQGVVHQELRPDEVFVVHAPGTMREWVKLAGFGVSSALARAGTAPPSRYRAPEQQPGAADDGDDPQSDQYSLAAIAYEMLAGVPPFDEGRSRAEPLPISDLAPGVNAAVDAAIRQALATEPEQRFPGVLEFARALRDAVEGASPEALRRRSGTNASAERRARVTEAVSPFFNPLQTRASEVFRRVVSSTARLKTLAGVPGRRGPAARIALAGTALLLAVTGTALALRHRAPTESSATTPPSSVAVAAPEPVAPPLEAPTPSAALAPDAAAAEADDEAAATDDAAAAKRARAAAWARLGTAAARASASPAPRPKAPPARPATRIASATPKAAAAKKAAAVPSKPAPVAKVAAATPKATAAPRPTAAAPTPTVAALKTPAAAPTPCVMSVGSKPPADVWIDDHSLGRRTPLVKYRTACGDHKLALKRTDLDLYQMEIVTLRAGAPFKKVYPLQ
jgi:eukaryotic-like serine/threonine-protein kinase